MSIGKIREFDCQSGKWSSYCERLAMYFTANAVKEEVKLATLISVVGDQCYELMASLASPKKPSDLTYKELVELMEKHIDPKPSVMAERYQFRQRIQRAGESILQYVAELKNMSRSCNFKDQLMENLKDQFACGVNNTIIRQRLFAEENLTFEKAVKLACALEAAEQNASAVTQRGAETGGTAGSGERCGTVHRLAASRTSSASPREQRGIGTGSNAHAAAGRNRSCSACGATNHSTFHCRYRNYACSLCKQKGHLRRVCPGNMDGGNNTINERKYIGKSRANAHYVAGESENSSSEDVEEDGEEEAVYRMALNHYKPVSLPMNVNGRQIIMEIDTGAASSFISKQTYETYFSDLRLDRSNTVFKFYDGTKIRPVGIITPLVEYNGISKQLDLYVLDRGETSLIGRQWLAELSIKIPVLRCPEGSDASISVNNVKANSNDLKMIIDRYKEVFDGNLGCYTGGKATLRVRPDAVPVYCRARPVPFAIRERIDAELDAMLKDGIIEPVECSDWATPLVPVAKKDGGLRVCADFKVTLNPVLMVDRYPLPRMEELFSNLSGGQQFTKIDLSQAYNQVCLTEESKMYTVINTHRGLFKYNRLVYGLSSSAGIFSRISASIVNGIPNTQSFCDDILITGNNKETHLIALEAILKRLQELGLKVKKSKCTFLADEVSYLGYIVSKAGIRPDPDKISAIAEMPSPNNTTELRSFLGMVNFYAKFVNNISKVLNPLYNLLQKGRHWGWTQDCAEAFKRVKSLLLSSEVLAHYDPQRALTLTCDASAQGVGGVLTQPDHRGAERPVAYISRKLNAAERNYSQIHREALAIVYCTRKFHQYLYGRRFTLRTDHKPLVSIFGPQTGVPSMTSSRMQRWALILTGYDFEIRYVNTNDNNADALSRLPLGQQDDFDPPEQSYLHFASDALLLDNNEIKIMTARDMLLGRVINYINRGWPDEVDIKELRPYFNRKAELYLELGCVMWGHRVVIPEACRHKVLRELHEPHMGIVKTKAMARSYVWWAGIDEAIEACCRACDVCAAVAPSPPAAPPVPWHWPARPYERVHLDFLGPQDGHMFLVAIDARTKWIEVYQMTRTSADCVITKLMQSWSRWGIPKQIVSDNGPPFSSIEFNNFLEKNGVQHLYSAPYHPSSNGAAEGAVKLIKAVIKKAKLEKVDLNAAICKFLLHYHSTPHSTTGESPARMLQGRELRLRLDALKPDRAAKVKHEQSKIVERTSQRHRQIPVGEQVRYKSYRPGDKWLDGTIVSQLGKSDYTVAANDGTVHHRHIDQMKQRLRNSCIFPTDDDPGLEASPITSRADQPASNRQHHTPLSVTTESKGEGSGGRSTSIMTGHNSSAASPQHGQDQGVEARNTIESEHTHHGENNSPVQERRYPSRTRNAPKRFGFEID